jgi:hypothetical protein
MDAECAIDTRMYNNILNENNIRAKNKPDTREHDTKSATM